MGTPRREGQSSCIFPGCCSAFSAFQAPKPDQLIKPGRDYNGPEMYGMAPAAAAASEPARERPMAAAPIARVSVAEPGAPAVALASPTSTREAPAVIPAGPLNPPPGSARKLLLKGEAA